MPITHFALLLMALCVTSVLLGAPPQSAPTTTSVTAPAAAPTFYYDVNLELEGALLSGTDPKDIRLTLGTNQDTWDKYGIGWAERRWLENGQMAPRSRWYNAMDHEAEITATRVVANAITLELNLRVNADPWTKPGTGTYTLSLTRTGTKYTGTFTGTFNNQPVSGKVAGTQRTTLWPAPLPDIKTFAPGEHPRLIFRKSDLPALRTRMQTPAGQLILARLKQQLGGGEAMPTQYNTAQSAYGAGANLPLGGYTLSHGMGFGFLYQLTGEQKYADLARQCVDKAVVEKIRDRDQRYSWDRPGGKLRAGSSYAAIAMAYDLCYDAWPADYRTALARQIQDKLHFKNPVTADGETVAAGEADGDGGKEKALAEPINVDLLFNTGGGQHSPMSNHYAAWNGGGGTALLAILGDPGTDDAITQRGHRIFQARAKRALTEGYGNAAFFFEGHFCGRLSTNTGLSTYLSALQVAEGKDYVANSPEARWLVAKWLYETVRHDNKLVVLDRGMYAHTQFDRMGHSAGGDYSQGFGIVPPEMKPAVLWFFNHVISPGAEKDYDAVLFPQRAVYAFVNWPLELKEQNPATTLPSYLRDTKAGFYVFRSGWSGTDADILASMQVNAMQEHSPALGVRSPGAIFGMGVRGDFAGLNAKEDSFQDVDQGQACIITSGTQAFIADMSGLSGAPMLLIEITGLHARGKPPLGQPPTRIGNVGAADDTPRFVKQPLRLGRLTVNVMTLGKGQAPTATVIDTDTGPILKIGPRTVTVTDGKISLK